MFSSLCRYDREGEPSQLAPVDVFVSTVDPLKEPPLITANTVLSILAVDYPVDKVSCYVSDDGSAMLTFEALSETAEFARKWVPFCKKHNIEPRAPEFYFAQKIDYLKDKIQPSFVKERRAMKVSKICTFYEIALSNSFSTFRAFEILKFLTFGVCALDNKNIIWKLQSMLYGSPKFIYSSYFRTINRWICIFLIF